MGQISFCRCGVRRQEEEDEARSLPRGDGTGGAVEGAAEGDRADLPVAGRGHGPYPVGGHAAGASDAELVCAERPGEHPFRVIKRQFGLLKVCFRGLQNNTAHLLIF